MNIFGFFKKIGQYLTKAVQIVRDVVPEEVLSAAIQWVKIAAGSQLDNAGKREYVVERLAKVFPGVSESILRLAVELAVRIVKKELNKL